MVHLVYAAVRAQFESRLADLFRFARTGSSFEEWLNFEAFVACGRIDGVRVHPRPRYLNVGVDGSRQFGDLLVEHEQTGERVMLEMACVHDWTGAKWIEKIDWDGQKLAQLPRQNGARGLQIIVLLSSEGPVDSDRWKRWLSRTALAAREPDYRVTDDPTGTGRWDVLAWVHG